MSFEPNPHHKRAQLVVLTPKGQQTYEAALALYNPLVAALAQDLPAEDIAARVDARLAAAERKREVRCPHKKVFVPRHQSQVPVSTGRKRSRDKTFLEFPNPRKPKLCLGRPENI